MTHRLRLPALVIALTPGLLVAQRARALRRTYVIVHGAWVGGWDWHGVGLPASRSLACRYRFSACFSTTPSSVSIGLIPSTSASVGAISTTRTRASYLPG